MKKNVVVMGGGNGTALCLRALKPYIDEIELSAVVSTSDSGGSSGRLRRAMGVLPTGDILRAIISLSSYDHHILRKVFYKTRFTDVGKLNDHNLGNLFLALSGEYADNTIDAIRAMEQAVNAVGHVYPATLELADLCVELTSGEKIRGEAEIDVPTYDRSKKIVKAWLEPKAAIYQHAREVIERADYIFLGLGSLYTSVIPNLLVDGMGEAILRSRAKLVFVTGSCYELGGETGPECLSAFFAQLQSYLPRSIDALVYSTHEFSTDEHRQLVEKRWERMIDDSKNISIAIKWGVDFEKTGGGTDPEKLGKFLKDNILI